MAKLKTEAFEETLKDGQNVLVELKARRQHAFRCYARALRELEDMESILRDVWSSVSCIRGLLQEQTAVMTSSAEIFEV
jgi:hypothetical protein